MTITLQRGGQVVATFSLEHGPVYIGREHAILKRKLQAKDNCIPRRAACLSVDPHHSGTLSMSNPHEKIELEFQLPDGGNVILRAQEETAIPSGITLWGNMKLHYSLSQPTIWAMDTQDEDATDDEEEEAARRGRSEFSGGEAQPVEDYWQRNGSQYSE